MKRKKRWGRPGASNVSQGRGLQDSINTWNQLYLSEGRAIVFPVPPQFRLVPFGHGRKGITVGLNATCYNLVFSAKAPPDYMGIITDGRITEVTLPVLFEVKSCGEHWRYHEWWEDRRHQLDLLRRWSEAGGVAFVLLRSTSLVDVNNGKGSPFYCMPNLLIPYTVVADLCSKQNSVSVHKLLATPGIIVSASSDWLTMLHKSALVDSAQAVLRSSLNLVV